MPQVNADLGVSQKSVEAAQPDTSPGKVHRQLTLNSVSNLIRYVAAVGIAFFLTPFTVHTLGEAAYGFWILVLSVVGYANILELGIQPAVVKFVGQMKASANIKLLNEIISAAFIFFLLAGIVGALAFSVVLPSFLRKLPGNLHGVGHTGVLASLIAFDIFILFISQLYTGILYGWQQYLAKNYIDIAGSLINAVLLVIFLPSGGLPALAASKAGIDLVALILTIALCHRMLPQLKLRLRDIQKDSFKRLFGFGSRIFISATATRVGNYAQPVIITTFQSAAATTFFAIPSSLVDYTRQVIWALATGFMPMFSELESRNEKSLLRSIYISYSRYILLFILPAIILISVYGIAFLTLWIGPTIAHEGRWVLILLTIAVFVESCQPLIWRLFIGVARLNFLVTVSTTSSLLLIVLSILATKSFGVTGVAMSLLATTVLSQLLFVPYVCKFLEITVAGMVRQVHMPVLYAGIPTFGFCFIISKTVGNTSYLHLVIGSILTTLFYVLIAYAVSLNTQEKSWISGKAIIWMRQVMRLPSRQASSDGFR